MIEDEVKSIREELDDAWAATGRSGPLRGMCTLAEVIIGIIDNDNDRIKSLETKIEQMHKAARLWNLDTQHRCLPQDTTDPCWICQAFVRE
jgi:phosphoribosyl-dephospho-CoA transferase